MENIGSENHVEGSCEEEDVGEIMVGSDVFVDGVSGEKDGSVVSGEVGDVGGAVADNGEETETQSIPEAMDGLNEGVGNGSEKSEVEHLALKGEKSNVVSEELEVGFSEGSVVTEKSSREVGVSCGGVLDPEIEAIMVTEQSEETVDTEEGSVNVRTSNHVIPELQVDTIVASAVVCSTLREETLASVENVTGHDCLEVGFVTTCEEATASHFGIPGISVNSNGDGLDTTQINGIAGDFSLVDADAISPVDHNHMDSNHSITVDCSISAPDVSPPTCIGVETLNTESSKNGVLGAHAESISPYGDSVMDREVVDNDEVHAAESQDSILKLDALYSDVQDENQGFSKELPGVKCEATHGVDDNSCAIPEAVHGKSLVSEREEVTGADLDDVLDLKNGASDINNLSCCLGNKKCLKTDGDLEAGAVPQNHVLPTEPILLVDDDDSVGINTDKGIKIEIRAGIEEILHPTDSCPSEGKEILQKDSSAYDQPIIAMSVAEVTNDQDNATGQANIVDAVGSSDQGDGMNEIAVPFFGCQEVEKSSARDVSTGNTCLLENGVCSKVDIMMADNHVAYDDPVISGVEIGHDNLAEECGSSQSKKQEVLLRETETTLDVVHVTELHVSSTNISLLDGTSIEDTCMADVAISEDGVNKSQEAEDNSRKSNDDHIAEGHASETEPMDVVEETEFDQGGKVECRGAELGPEKTSSLADKSSLSNEEPVKSTGSLGMNQSGYLLPPENDGHFALSDLVWGKVRSHPWWPGQIFDRSDASEKAIKYYKKDSYLVAYFGDRTFAWNDASLLKPFRSHFSQVEKQSNSEGFQNAVTCALEEVSRRVELGLACSCIPKDAYVNIESQVVENTGIREESSQRYGVDQSSRAASFEPDKLVEFVRDLAQNASSWADRLDLVIAQAQLSAFCRFKGYRLPTGMISSPELLGNDANAAQNSDQVVVTNKRKHIPKDSLQSRMKERSLTELMSADQFAYSPDDEDESCKKDLGRSSGKKRKALNPLADGSDKRVNSYAAKVSTSMNQTPKSSFKIGECILRVASQLTGSASMMKGHNDEMGIDGSPKINVQSGRQSIVVSAESFSLNEMLLQLQLVAQDPMKRRDFLNTIVTFFSDFRSSVAVNKRGRKKKSNKRVSECAEEFEFDDVNDSYWTDRIVHNYSEDQLLDNSENGTGNVQLVPFGSGKSVKSGSRKSNSRKRHFSKNNPTKESMQSDENVKRRKQEAAPAELILNFAERTSIPSEINLNKMFRRFGPLMESETEVDHDSSRAKVIFKRGSDAEVAHSSAEKFSLFGPVLVNYQIGYTPLISVKISPLAIPQFQEDAALVL